MQGFEQHKLLATPHLQVTYQPRDFRAMGESWKIITEDSLNPKESTLSARDGSHSRLLRNFVG